MDNSFKYSNRNVILRENKNSIQKTENLWTILMVNFSSRIKSDKLKDKLIWICLLLNYWLKKMIFSENHRLNSAP